MFQSITSSIRNAQIARWTRHPLYSTDAKGARVYSSYDRLGRPTGVWARDKGVEHFTRRQVLIYGDQLGRSCSNPSPPPSATPRSSVGQGIQEEGQGQVG